MSKFVTRTYVIKSRGVCYPGELILIAEVRLFGVRVFSETYCLNGEFDMAAWGAPYNFNSVGHALQVLHRAIWLSAWQRVKARRQLPPVFVRIPPWPKDNP